MWELVSFASLKALLGLGDSAIADYPALNVLKSSVEAAIESFLGRDLESSERTESFYIAGPTNMISLRAIPVASVASLTVTMLGETETYNANDNDYIITRYGLKVYSQLEDAKVDITYTGGLSAVPSNIERAALLQTAYEFLGKDNIGAETVSNEGGSVSRPSLNLLPVVKSLLNRDIHPLKITGK